MTPAGSVPSVTATVLDPVKATRGLMLMVALVPGPVLVLQVSEIEAGAATNTFCAFAVCAIANEASKPSMTREVAIRIVLERVVLEIVSSI